MPLFYLIGMMKSVIFFVAALITHNGYTQLFIKNKVKMGFIGGLQTAGALYQYKNPHTFEKFHLYNVHIDTHVGYFFNNNFGLGVTAVKGFLQSNIEPFSMYNNQKFHGIGVYGRYYIPLKINIKVLDRMLFFLEVVYRKTNFTRTNDWIYVHGNTLKYNLTKIIPFGMQMRVWKNLFIGTSFEYLIFTEKIRYPVYRTGFEYHFKGNRKK